MVEGGIQLSGDLSKKKISFIVGEMGQGGAERVVSLIANHLINKGYLIDIVMLLNYNCEYQLDRRIRLIDLTSGTDSYLRSARTWVHKLRRYFIDSNTDIIISFIARVNLVAIVASLGLNKRIIVSERSDPANDGRSCIVDISTKILYRLTDTIVFQTKHAQEHFGKKVKDKSIIITNPLTLTVKCSKPAEKKVVAVGRLKKGKNHRMLINAFSGVAKEYPDYTLWIYGEGPLRGELTKQISDLGLENHVFLPGGFQDIHDRIKDAQIFVLSSYHEGLSNALLEAMYMGFPCISTRCAGTEEYIDNNVSGLIVENDNAEAMREAIVYLINNERIRDEFGIKAQERVKECNVTDVMNKWEWIINK